MSSTLTDLTAATTWSGTDLFYALVGGNSRKIAAAKFLVAETSSSLAMQDSTTAQTFRVYRTFTDSSNYERLAFYSGAGYFQIEPQTAGTGTDDISLAFAATGTGKIVIQNQLQIVNSVGPIAGGSAGQSLTISSAFVGMYIGTGAPTVSAGKGSIYLRVDGSSTSTRVYVNTDGSTGWTNLTSAT